MDYNKRIYDMAAGDQVEGYYVLKSAQSRTSSNGKPFLAAVLSDKTGSIEAKAWDYAGPISQRDEGQVLKIRGTVSEFRGALQLTMERLRLSEPGDPVDRGSLVAAAPIDGERAWAEVQKLVDSIADRDYRGVCRRLLEEKGEALRTIPAAKSVHHGFLGGLLMHTWTMLRMADFLAGLYAGTVDRSLLLAGTLLHDLSKAEEFSFSPLGLVTEYSARGQLLGHLTAMETLHNMMPEILAEHGQEKGTTIITYLQYMIDKCLDYNSRQTRWEYTRSVIKGTFGRHDFSLKWTFGEMIFTGINSGLAWGKSQVLDAYRGICELINYKTAKPATVLNGSAANIAIPDQSVDVICVDPPYYNNVQYAELSDYFYVWQKRTFRNLYPEVFGRRLTNKTDEAVANPVRDGGAKEADQVYEQRMREIFNECHRVLVDDGIITMMFTHKTQAAWETLTKALIESGWMITSAFPVHSEGANSTHQKDMAAAASSIFLA